VARESASGYAIFSILDAIFVDTLLDEWFDKMFGDV